ncbi:hypothetical protein EV363DRAFT_1422996 [Boletus edulis]|nr:hypothetical protein EV363DRAFT_1422996 [Boletus edulis]
MDGTAVSVVLDIVGVESTSSSDVHGDKSESTAAPVAVLALLLKMLEMLESPDDGTLGCLDNGTLGCPDDRTLGFPDDRTLGFPDDRTLGFPDDRTLGFPDDRTLRFPDDRTSWTSGSGVAKSNCLCSTYLIGSDVVGAEQGTVIRGTLLNVHMSEPESTLSLIQAPKECYYLLPANLTTFISKRGPCSFQPFSLCKNDFGDFIKLQEASERCQGWNLETYLIESVNRLAQYPEVFRASVDHGLCHFAHQFGAETATADAKVTP